MKKLTLQIGDMVLNKDWKKVENLSYQKIVEEALIKEWYKNVFQIDMGTIVEYIEIHKSDFMDFVWGKIEKHEKEAEEEKKRVAKVIAEQEKKNKAKK